METVTITLDGREVSGQLGTTVLELARESGVSIPTLCHDPDLVPIGACRVCLVEDERSGRLLASCVTPIESGMVIDTRSERVIDRRRTIVSLMLASHPDSCMVCDKGNRCELRAIAADLGIGFVGFYRIPQPATIEEVNPFIERDLSKCILCAKCIRVDHEIVVQGAIDYMDRGFASRPATLNDQPLEKSECSFCGACVAVCPTGALMEKDRVYGGTAQRSVPTVCPLCGCGCPIVLEVKGDQIIRVRPDRNRAGGSPALCVRGSYGYDFVQNSDRLKRPLIRNGNGFEEASWDEALAHVASRLGQVMSEKGPDAVAALGSTKCTNEENYLLQRFVREVLGTNNVDNGARLYNTASYLGLGRTLGFPGTTSCLRNVEESEVILVAGADLESSAPTVSYAVKRAVRNRGASLILVDPRLTGLSRFARILLRPRVGTDVALLNGMAKVIVGEGLTDDEFVARKTDNFEALKPGLDTFSPEYVERVTGVTANDVRDAARLFGQANRASIVFGSGITQQSRGTDNVIALANLAMLTGNVGRKSGIYVIQRDCNSQGASDMGAIPDLLPGYKCLDDSSARSAYSARWGVDLPDGPGLTYTEMVERAGTGQLRAMYVVGEDPVSVLPQPELVAGALRELQFLVVQDMFMTETAKLADVVLPACSFAEKSGSYTNFEGRVQRLEPALEPAGESLPDWEIILRLAETMGRGMPYVSLGQVTEEVEDMVPLCRPWGGGDDVTGEVTHKGGRAAEVQARRLYKGQFPSGFGRFCPVEFAIPDATVDGYPITLVTGTESAWTSGSSRGAWSARLTEFGKPTHLQIGETDARELRIEDGDTVKVVSSSGEIASVARYVRTLPRGVVFMSCPNPGNGVNSLFGTVLDPLSKAPAMKACGVRLERV